MGDLNVAPTELDIYSTKGKNRVHGFTHEERDTYSKLLSECDMKDAYRVLYPTQRVYTWFSMITRSRDKNNGWFIDRFVLSKTLVKHVKHAAVLSTYFGSDHVPVVLDMSIPTQVKNRT